MRVAGNVSATHFGIFRIVFGLYLVALFTTYLSVAGPILSAEGMLSDFSFRKNSLFPDPFAVFSSTLEAQLLIAFWILCALCFTVGWHRPLFAIALWIGWVTVNSRNILISGPHYGFIGWLLLACAIIPGGEAYAWSEKPKPEWRIPRSIIWSAWFVVGFTYTVSGLLKLASPSWVDGTAFGYSIQVIYGRDSWLNELIIHSSETAISFFTYSALFAEIFCLPLSLHRLTRPIIWLAITLMNASLLLLLTIEDISLGLLIVQFFLFDPRWLSFLKRQPYEHIER